MTTDGDRFSWPIREIPHGSEAYRRTIELRERVLRRPLGLTFSHDDLASEAGQLHFAILDEASEPRCLACLVLVPVSPREMKMRQVAVEAAYRGSGVGSALVRHAEVFAAGLGCEVIFCHARESAFAFYERLGYTSAGEGFMEVGLPHRRMERRLIPATTP